MIKVCLNCGKDCGNFICTDCTELRTVNALCERLCAYSPESGDEFFDSISGNLREPANLKNIIFALTSDLNSPNKELLRIKCIAGKLSVPKSSRNWLRQNAKTVLNSDISDEDKQYVKGLVLNSLYGDYFYDKAEAVAEELKNSEIISAVALHNLAKFYIITRRYELAENLLNGASERFPEFTRYFAKLTDELSERRNGKHYIPLPKTDRIETQKKFNAFLRKIGVEKELPTQQERPRAARKQPEKITASDYPELLEIREAGFKRFVAFDVETTGLSPKTDAIIEIGAIRVVDGVISEDEKFIFQTLVKPYKKAISERVTELTGISSDDVENAPQMWEMFEKFADFIGDDILLGYNNVAFDSKFLIRAGRYANRIISNKQFDVMRYAGGLLDKLGISKKTATLTELSDALSIENPRAHRALADAITTAHVYLKLLELDSGKRDSSLDEMLSDIDSW